MRDSRAVCLLCRSVAAGRRPLLAPWPRARATATATAASISAVAARASPAPAATTQKNDDTAPPARPSPAPATATAPARPATDRSAASLAIFESVVNGRRDQAAGPPGVASDVGLGTFGDLAGLSHMLDKPGAPVAHLYRQFRDSIYPSLCDSQHIPELFKTRISQLLQMVSAAIAQNPSDRALPSLAEFTQVSLKLRLLKFSDWVAVTRAVLEFVSSVDPSPDRYENIESYELVLGRRALALESLVNSWKLLTLPRELLDQLPPVGGIEKAQFTVPTHPNKAFQRAPDQRNLRLALCDFFPQHPPTAVDPAIPLLIATFVVVNDTTLCPYSLRAAAAPLLAPIASLLPRMASRERPEETPLRHITEVPDELAGYMTSRWPAVLNQLIGTSGSTYGVSGNTKFTKADLSGANRKPVSTINRDLQDAFANGDLGAVEAVWREFWGSAPQPDQKTRSFLKANVPIFHQFIMIFTAMNMPQRSVQVWNSMTAIGITPDVRTYTSMMKGFKHARSLRGVANTWERLVASGLKLDVHAWTARVDGLTHCGKPGDGLRALEEMAVRWEAHSVGGRKEGAHMAVKPSIGPVNAALVGLLRLDGIAAARKLLAWAQRHDIMPDIATYNTLLRTLIRDGPQGAMAVINMMKQQGLKPDDMTVTIILDALVPTISAAKGPEEKVAMVRRIIGIIKEISSGKNQHAHTKLLYLVLKEGNDHEDPAVREILAHIWTSDQKPNAYVYTILVGHYLSRDPPQVKLVRSLIENHGLFDNSAVDCVFWERVMNGYLLVGDLDCALEVLDKVRTSTGLTMTLLEKLLRALVNQGRMPEADALVKRVKDDRLALSENSGLEPRFWNHGFFGFATECGLH